MQLILCWSDVFLKMPKIALSLHRMLVVNSENWESEILAEFDFVKKCDEHNRGYKALCIESRYAQLIIAELKVIKSGAATVQLAIGYIYHGAKPVYW